MYEYLPRTRTLRIGHWVIIALVCLTTFPIHTFASTDITPGQTAAVSDTGGDPINLRSKPHTASQILTTVWEGDQVEVIEGPIQDASGIWWYKVVANGTRAYIAAEFLSVAGGGSTANPYGTVTGSATIGNTGGDPINCRAGASAEYSVVTTFVDGDAIDLTGEPAGAWQPVNCGGQGGFVHTDFVGYDGDSPDQADDDAFEAAASRPGKIVNTGGDPINLRSKPRTTSSVLGTVVEGTRVTVLTGPITDASGMQWYKVIANGTRAYVFAAYVQDSGNPGPNPTATPNPGSETGVIAGTNGDGVRCRSKASTSGSVITVLSEGTSVALRGSAAKGWQPVKCAGRNGYVSSDYIDIGDGTGPTPTPTPGDGDVNHSFKAGDDVVVANTNGEGVRLRSKASSSSSVITVLPEGQALVVRKGGSGEWVAVTYRTSNGFVHMDFLTKAAASTPEPNGDLAKGDHAEVTDDLNFRDSPSFSGSVISAVPAGTVVLITGKARNGFYPVEIAGFPGFLHGDYLRWTDKDLTDNGGDDGIGGDPGDGPLTPQGKKMINYAMKFLGYPYVWATHGPDSFDCSGFTYYVTLNTLKMDIGAGTWSQSVSGRPVQFGDLRPGDLVFFQNTFTWGLSHVGIYIGDGKFIHAENETTGVVVSSLSSTYYKTRWYGARRITSD